MAGFRFLAAAIGRDANRSHRQILIRTAKSDRKVTVLGLLRAIRPLLTGC